MDEIEGSRLEFAVEQVINDALRWRSLPPREVNERHGAGARLTSVPTTWPEGATHSLRIRSQPIAPQPTSKARPPDPLPIFERSCRPVDSHT